MQIFYESAGSNSHCRLVATTKRRTHEFGNNTPSIRAFGMFTWAHAVVRNNFQKRLSNMLAVKNALLQSAVICHLKYLSFSKLNASVLNTGLFTVDKMLTNIGKKLQRG